MNRKLKILRFILKIFIINIILTNKLASDNLHEDLLNKIDQSFPAEIFFIQTDSNKVDSGGWMIVGKNGLARIEFEPPSHIVMVADGNWLVVHDAQYDRTSYLPLDKGILGALLNPKEFNSLNKLEVSKIENDFTTGYSVVSENFSGSELRIYFKNSDNILSNWEILENGKISIRVKILKIKKLENIKGLDKNIFKFLDSMRADKKAFLGPYERNFKKLPTSNSN